MSTLRQAAETALEALEYGQHTLKQVSENQWESRGQLAVQALRTALAEPVQEPVAWIGYINGVANDLAFEPFDLDSDVKKPLFTAPPQRKPLTREEAITLWADKSDGPSNGEIVSFARAVERAHGIT